MRWHTKKDKYEVWEELISEWMLSRGVNGIGSSELAQFGLLTTSTGGKMIGGVFRQLDENLHHGMN